MAILRENTLDFISSSVQQTERLGIRLGELLEPYDLICLYGEMGAGKTALSRGIGRGWGTTARITSPTFTLVNEYPRSADGMILYHMDFYRLERSADIITSGFEELLDKRAVLLLEWPERAEAFLPVSRLKIMLRTINETKRGLCFEAIGDRPKALLQQFRKSAFGI